MERSKPEVDIVRLSCLEAGWESVLEAGLAQGREVELIHFSALVDGEACQKLATGYGFAFHSVPEIYFASFRQSAR